MDEYQLKLETFARAATLSDLVESGRPLLKTSAAAAAARSPVFKTGLDRLVGHFSANDDTQLRAIAFAWRLTAVTSMKEHRRFVIERLGLRSPAPTELPTIMPDPDDRKNLAEALRWKPDPWVLDYLIKSIANEKDGKQARIASCASLLAQDISLSTCFSDLAVELRRLKLEQKDQNLGRARQLNNILISLSEAVWNCPDEIKTGDAVGESYARLINSVPHLGEISDRALKIDLAKSSIDFYIALARINTPLSASTESFDFLKVIRRLFGSSDWPKELEDKLGTLSNMISQQLIFLLRLGKPDNELRSLILLLKGEVSGTLYLKNLARNNQSLSDDDRYWLESGRGRRTSGTDIAIGESALALFDRDLAELLRDVDQLAHEQVAAAEALESEADLLGGLTSTRLRKYLQLSRVANTKAMKLIERRNLSAHGRIGEVLEFNPNEHEPSEGAIGEKTVRMRAKYVSKHLEGGTSVVILKADVDKA